MKGMAFGWFTSKPAINGGSRSMSSVSKGIPDNSLKPKPLRGPDQFSP
jgi:hypothetical protein